MSQAEVSSAFLLGKEDTGSGKEQSCGIGVGPSVYQKFPCLGFKVKLVINQNCCFLTAEAVARQYWMIGSKPHSGVMRERNGWVCFFSAVWFFSYGALTTALPP